MKALQSALRAHVMKLPGDSAHDIGHFDRVWRNAQSIAAKEPPCDMDVLLATSYLHDLVNLPKDHPDRARASALSANAAEPLLRDLGFDDDQIRTAHHAITAHSFSAKITPSSTEAKILQDADRIDALGAIGLARCFAVSGALDRPIVHSSDPFAQRRPLADDTYAVDHFASKLLRLPDTMQTLGGRQLAAERAGVLRRFLSDLATELGTDAPAW